MHFKSGRLFPISVGQLKSTGLDKDSSNLSDSSYQIVDKNKHF